MHKYRRLLPYVLRQWPALLFIGLLTSLTAITVALQPWPLKVLVDHALAASALPPALQSWFEAISVSPTPAALIVAAAAASLGLFVFNSLLDVGLTWAWS